MKKLILSLLVFSGASAFACNDRDFVFVSASSTRIQTTLEKTYTPACLKVKKGTAVTIAASEHHPLQGVQLKNQPKNPFVSAVAAKSNQTRVLSVVGDYPFFCTAHGNSNGGGMAGEIRVVD